MDKTKVKLFFSIKLVNSIYKVLPLFEEKDKNFKEYINSLILELEGVCQYLTLESADVLSLIGILTMLKGIELDNSNHGIVKKEVFKAIKISKFISSELV